MYRIIYVETYSSTPPGRSSVRAILALPGVKYNSNKYNYDAKRDVMDADSLRTAQSSILSLSNSQKLIVDLNNIPLKGL